MVMELDPREAIARVDLARQADSIGVSSVSMDGVFPGHQSSSSSSSSLSSSAAPSSLAASLKQQQAVSAQSRATLGGALSAAKESFFRSFLKH